MTERTLQLLLADDDTDDCLFFQEALAELQMAVSLTIVGDGKELMEMLESEVPHPSAIYLDLNMPRMNGYECLLEIKKNDKLKGLPVIIYSTSLNDEMVEKTYRSGASYYIRKPADFQDLKSVIMKSITLIPGIGHKQTPKENYVVDSK